MRAHLPVSYRDAKAIFLFSNTMDCDPASGLQEDSATLVRTLVLRKLLPDSLMSRISLQVSLTTTRTHRHTMSPLCDG